MPTLLKSILALTSIMVMMVEAVAADQLFELMEEAGAVDSLQKYIELHDTSMPSDDAAWQLRWWFGSGTTCWRTLGTLTSCSTPMTCSWRPAARRRLRTSVRSS